MCLYYITQCALGPFTKDIPSLEVSNEVDKNQQGIKVFTYKPATIAVETCYTCQYTVFPLKSTKALFKKPNFMTWHYERVVFFRGQCSLEDSVQCKFYTMKLYTMFSFPE